MKVHVLSGLACGVFVLPFAVLLSVMLGITIVLGGLWSYLLSGVRCLDGEES